jgi:hypothetical protein
MNMEGISGPRYLEVEEDELDGGEEPGPGDDEAPPEDPDEESAFARFL